MSDLTPTPLSPPETLPPVEIFDYAPRRQRYWLHSLLLVLTFFTTLVVGALLQTNFENSQPAFTPIDGSSDWLALFPVHWVWQQPGRLLLGLPFSLSLMGILLAHEMGHYLYCRRYQVDATLPYFIPAPTLIGTLGAFIRIKSAIRSRAELFDIGIAGPIAGFVLAVPVMLVGLALSRPTPVVPDADVQFGFPLIFRIGWAIVHHAANVPLQQLYLHPVTIAAWVGMFATSLNLLPGGQLDGGHIVYAVWPRAHKWLTRLAIVALVPMAYYGWIGWIIWAVMLALSGMRHPTVSRWPPLDSRRRWLALIALALLVLTVLPAPFAGSSVAEAIRQTNGR